MATTKLPKIHPYCSHNFCKPSLQSAGTDRHLQGITQRMKPRTRAPAVSHHHKEPLATGEPERQEQMGSDGDAESDAKAGRINLSQHLQREHILNLFQDPDLEPSRKPRGQSGSRTSRFPPAKGQKKGRAGRRKAKVVPRRFPAPIRKGRAELPGRYPALTRPYQCHSPG